MPDSDEQPPWFRVPFSYQDPTKLTTDAVNKLDADISIRLEALRELMESKIEYVDGIHTQKFDGVKSQFVSNDIALQTAFKGNKDLIDAQNKASTEAAKKAEEAFKEQITALTTFMNATFSSMNKSVDDLKTMVISGASTGKGAEAQLAKVMSGAALAITIVGFLFLVASHGWQSAPAPAPAPSVGWSK